jgi:glycosyltransferase involved in cell wall biosynthesis
MFYKTLNAKAKSFLQKISLERPKPKDPIISGLEHIYIRIVRDGFFERGFRDLDIGLKRAKSDFERSAYQVTQETLIKNSGSTSNDLPADFEKKPKECSLRLRKLKQNLASIQEVYCQKNAMKQEQIEVDVLLVSDFTLPGGSNSSNYQEILANHKLGLSTGLLHWPRYEMDAKMDLNPKIQEVVSNGITAFVDRHEKVVSKLTILRYPPSLMDIPTFESEFHTDSCRIVVNQTPFETYPNIESDRIYSIEQCDRNFRAVFGTKPEWSANSAPVLRFLKTHHKDELDSVCFNDSLWSNIIDFDDWDGPRKKCPAPTIGRHSRDNRFKWPHGISHLNKAYPNTANLKVLILGGVKSLVEDEINIPKNWEVYEFGELSVKDFMRRVGVFVYYTDDRRVASCDRVILEAIASGIPVILPEKEREVFGECAIYSGIDNAEEKANELIGSPQLYQSVSERSYHIAKSKFGLWVHSKRIQCDL